jgi:hypothetical protein
MDFKFIFLVFSKELLHATMRLKLRLKGRVLRKKFVFAHKILVFHFFSLFSLVILHDVIFNVTATI